ncbi:MAG: DCC1-like thiol-disulfide oxidoreductase family protein [Taibaiella sp.]|nr:DCC1-like thiol-disulfide oxidoreductase family protein [Taibaiella sp.]
MAFPPKPILFFDGSCNLCDQSVQFVIRHDKKKRFRFATLQSAAGSNALLQSAVSADSKESVILFFRGRYYTRSSAALHTLRLLGGIWSLLFAFIIIPSFIRDTVYDYVARNRYKWFGKKENCIISTPEIAARFINE